MPQSTMQEEEPFKFEEDVPYRAQLIEVKEKHREGKSQKTGEEYSFTRWVWKFQIVGGEKSGEWCWGETEDKLTTHPDNKVRQWGETLRGRPFEVGEGLDTDDLLGLECYLTFSNRTYDKSNGEKGYASDIADVFPLDDAAADPWQTSAQPPY